MHLALLRLYGNNSQIFNLLSWLVADASIRLQLGRVARFRKSLGPTLKQVTASKSLIRVAIWTRSVRH